MSRTLARLALVCALAGLAASGAAAYVHYHLLRDPSYLSFCDVSATVSCTQVYASRYGTLHGIPVALLGAIWFVFATLLAVAGLTARPSVRDGVSGYLFAGSTLALSMVLYLGYASLVLLKMVCILCVITYAAVIGLFLVSGAATSVPMTSLPRRISQDLKVLLSSPLAIALTLLFLGGAASTLAFFPREGAADAAPVAASIQDQRSDFERWYTAQPRVSLVIPSEGAKVLVVKFNDYQCPPCRQSFMDYKGVFARYDSSQPGAVRLVLKDFPLNSTCNAAVTTTLHPSACDAAVAVRLAGEHDRVAPLQEWLFANQPTLTPQGVRQAAREVGQVTNFDARYEMTLEQVKADTAYGRQLGVHSTPTFFINGVKIEGALPAQYFDQAIAFELARATK
jgi:uncharacterized membrane protein/protein-disulfide isomerase